MLITLNSLHYIEFSLGIITVCILESRCKLVWIVLDDYHDLVIVNYLASYDVVHALLFVHGLVCVICLLC